MMRTAKLFVMFLLAGLLLVVVAGPASAAVDVRSTACWNNCPIGGDTKLY